MLILEIVLSHFGKFHDKKIAFSPGINVIYGDNEAGKTTVHSFIRGIILGIEKPRGRESKDDLYSKYLPWVTPTMYGGTMQIQTADREYLVERSFYKGNKHLRVADLTTGREQEYETWQIPPQFGRVTKGSYRNTISMEQNKSTTDNELEIQMKNYMANLTTSKSNEVDIANALQALAEKKKELRNPILLERMDQIKKEMEELPVLERQRKRIEEEIIKIPLEGKTGLVEEESSINKNAPKMKMRRAWFSTVFAVLWSMFMLIVLLMQGERRMEQIPLYIVVLLLGVILYCSLLRRDKAKKLFDYERGSLNSQNKELADEQVQNIIMKKERLGWELEQVEEKIGRLEWKREEEKELLKAIEASNENIAAIDLATNTIQQLSQEIHDGFGKQFNERISALVDEITNHTYEKVYVDEKLNIKVQIKNSLISVWQLSAGTIDQIFLALRLAAAEMLLKQEKMPIILDDSLALYDEKRCRATLSMLASGNKQVILFTCHKREIGILDEWNIEYNLIEL